MSDLQITGTDSLIKRLQKGVEMEDVRRAIKQNGAEMQAGAQQYVTVDTGALKRSIELEIMDKGFTAKVKPTMEYAQYVEYGTRKQSAQPYMRPAFHVQKLIFLSDMAKLLK